MQGDLHRAVPADKRTFAIEALRRARGAARRLEAIGRAVVATVEEEFPALRPLLAPVRRAYRVLRARSLSFLRTRGVVVYSRMRAAASVALGRNPGGAVAASPATPGEAVARLQLLTALNNALTGENNRLTQTVGALTANVNRLTGLNNTLTEKNNALTARNNELFGRASELELSNRRVAALARSLDDGSLPRTAADETQPIHPTLVDAPLCIEEALIQAAKLRQVSRRIQDGYYAERLILVTCLEKSGSTTLEICVREMQQRTAGVAHDVGIQKTLEFGPFSFSDALYPEVLLYALDGGVLRGVQRPTMYNLALLRLWQCKQLVLFRHPADRLVGRYCDPTPRRITTARGRVFREDPQYLVSDIFAPDREMEEVFDELIRAGYLWDTLTWMADWAYFADPERARVVRYEDMRADPRRCFADLHGFLFMDPLPDEVWRSVEVQLGRYRKELQPGAKESRRYPRGYSGSVGIARAYFSEANLERYRETVERFVEDHPHGKLLLAHYPDLALRGEPEPGASTETHVRETQGGAGAG